ncbi:Trans-1_2-dihydrobenzene-1_2-diol dehydrogenase [Caligus rogercresseyi]|uniref:Trans-1_2-dihydrobenzene-1_2-diol dehydrogenase n=1 Tax=Caligus rogercresseyi TaxID=217165 RepID=A0A7T8JUP4_CALRO|nr:Trans-1_2-dihydrobenzene-1_2-diol dehydrogenase [Caligus rogercresseyi]
MDLGGGTVLDLGVYCVQLLKLSIHGEEPSSISSKGSLNAEKTDRNTSSLFAYGDGCRMASISTHSELNMPCEANIFGSQGSIKLPFLLGPRED